MCLLPPDSSETTIYVAIFLISWWHCYVEKYGILACDKRIHDGKGKFGMLAYWSNT